MSAIEPIVEALEVSKTYDTGKVQVNALCDIDLVVARGEMVGVMGPSGSGKSTLLNCLSGLDAIDRGDVLIEGVSLKSMSDRQRTDYRARHMGFVFQFYNLIPSLTARDNVQAPLWAAGVPARRARSRAQELLERVGLGDRLGHRPGDLSGGQQQRVAIARALAHDPPLVLADEPTAHLDYIQVEGVLQLLRTLAEPGRIVVVATHDERLLPLADQIVRLSPAAAAAPQPPRRLELPPGQVVFEQGARSDLVYTVEEGEIEIVRQRTDGGVELLALLGPGRYFGELGPLFGLQRSATARAVKHTVLTGYSVRDFRDLVGSGRLAEAIGGPSY
jgi:putative ABC transport system ATP-binding protein